MNDQAPTIFEDGEQSRDFVNVKDIVAANLLALETDGGDYNAFNIGKCFYQAHSTNEVSIWFFIDISSSGIFIVFFKCSKYFRDRYIHGQEPLRIHCNFVLF